MIKENLTQLKQNIPENVKIIAVSKFKPEADILEAYEAGQRDFGENYVQEMETKAEALPKDINWHFIGNLQRNKVKYIAPFIHLIHSVDSLRLLKEINKQAIRNERTIECLLQIHIADEETKFGWDMESYKALLESGELEELSNVKVIGLMGMSTMTDDEDQVVDEFKQLARLFELGKAQYPEWTELSMGMSADYPLAIEQGSTMVRIGSTLFGAR